MIRELANAVDIPFDSCQAISMHVLGMGTCGSEDCYKIAKTKPHGHHSGDVDEIQRRSRFAQKFPNWLCVAMRLKPKPNSRFASIEKIKEKTVGNTKDRVLVVFRELEKTPA